jgi:hypothetical protein
MRTLALVAIVLASSANAEAPSGNGRTPSAIVDPRDYGAVGDGRTDDTAALRAALQAAADTGRIVLIPPGTFVTEPLNVGIGQIVRGSGRHSTILQSRSGGSVFEITGAGSPKSGKGGFVYSIELSDLGIRGVAQPWYPRAPYGVGEIVQSGANVYECTAAGTTGGTGPGTTGAAIVDGAVRWRWKRAVAAGGHGIHFHDNGPYGGPASIDLRNLYVSNVAGHGIYMVEEWSTTLENVDTDKTGGNGIDLQGGNTTTLIRCYPHQVGPGRAGYRIHGSAAFISCNGIDNPKAQANVDWAVLGDAVSEGDGAAHYPFATFSSCNAEDFSHRGIYVKEGGSIWIEGGTFQAPTSGEVVAIAVAWSSDAASVLSGQVRFMTKGATWARGAAIHALAGAGSPVLQIGASRATGEPLRYYSPAIGTTADVPTISSHYAGYVAGVPRSSVRLSAASLDDVVAMRLKGRSIDVGSGPPSTGTWQVGDMVWNGAPTPGSPPGWMCTQGGTPGTWKAMAPLEK